MDDGVFHVSFQEFIGVKKKLYDIDERMHCGSMRDVCGGLENILNEGYYHYLVLHNLYMCALDFNDCYIL